MRDTITFEEFIRSNLRTRTREGEFTFDVWIADGKLYIQSILRTEEGRIFVVIGNEVKSDD